MSELTNKIQKLISKKIDVFQNKFCVITIRYLANKSTT